MSAEQPTTVLTEEQARRAEACERAARLLRERPPVVGGRPAAAVDAIDVVHVAQWIIDGRDPWPSTILAAAPAEGDQ